MKRKRNKTNVGIVISPGMTIITGKEFIQILFKNLEFNNAAYIWNKWKEDAEKEFNVKLYELFTKAYKQYKGRSTHS